MRYRVPKTSIHSDSIDAIGDHAPIAYGRCAVAVGNLTLTRCLLSLSEGEHLCKVASP
jgi:hypothetical protein